MASFRPSVTRLEDRTTPVTLPTGFTETLLADGIDRPTAIAVAPDGRLFVAEQTGDLRVIANGALVSTPVLSVATDSAGERGLIGVTLDPNFSANGFVYVYYTVPGGGGAAPHNRVSRFTASGNVAAAGSETVLVDLDPLSAATNHNGGPLAFGPDGKLYVGVGENATPANAQSLANRLGKVLRINPDGTIPGDNPTTFDGIAGTTTGANRAIYAVGLRNPFSLSFSVSTGQLLIADVGQNSFEEIDAGRAGANYGWPATEGTFDQSAFPAFTEPVYAYPHTGFQPFAGVAISGGTFYNPPAGADRPFPEDYRGDYLFADFTKGWINRLDPATGQVTNFATGLTGTLQDGLAVAPNGDLLYLSIGSGAVYRITAPPSPPPTSPPVSPPPGPTPVVAVGAGLGGGSVAKLIDPTTLQPVLSVDVFPGFAGGVRVAAADVTGDGVTDLIAGAGPGGGPRVTVIDGATGTAAFDFFPFEATFRGGVYVSAGDLNRDGFADVIVSPGSGGGARVKVFSGKDGSVLTDFLAFADPNFRGGVTTGVGDATGDGFLELGIAVASGGGPRVVVFDGKASFPFTAPPAAALDFFVFDAAFTGGVYLASGDVNGDGADDLIVSPGVGGGPVVSVFDGSLFASGLPIGQTRIASFAAADAAARGGVTVAARDIDGDGAAEVIVGAGVGASPTVTAFRVAAGTGTSLGSGPVFEEAFKGGVFVG